MAGGIKSTAVGITSTVPIEIVYAAGRSAVDLNNAFISHEDGNLLVDRAERSGFPETSCAWIKGIYSAVQAGKIGTVVAVVQGDCSNTHALMEILEMEDIETIPFMYPYDRDRDMMRLQIAKFADALGADSVSIGETKARLDSIRARVAEIDRLTWEENLVSGFENHYYQISCSDMEGDPDAFESKVDQFLEAARRRQPRDCDLRLAYIGIPPIISGIYAFVEANGGAVVFNELQRQFSFPVHHADMVDQYVDYTYPYHIKHRLADISEQVRKRKVSGIIHYVQSFCFRRIEDIIIRKELDLPVLTLEANRPGKLDLRTKMRLEAFLDMLRYLR